MLWGCNITISAWDSVVVRFDGKVLVEPQSVGRVTKTDTHAFLYLYFIQYKPIGLGCSPIQKQTIMKKISILAVIGGAMLLGSCGGAKQMVTYTPQPIQAPVASPYNGTIIEEDPVGDLVKQFTADGYKSQSMAYTMREIINKFRTKVQSNENLVEIISDGSGASSFAAEMSAANAACLKYATQAGSVVRGGMERDFGSLGKDYDNFHGTYVQNVAKFVMPLLKAEMTFVKKEQNKYFVRIGYTLDEVKAAQARNNAFNEALQDEANGQIFGEQARKYVNEIVRPEE